MAVPAITNGTEHFNTKLYTGDGNTNQEIDVGIDSDFNWIKSRSNSNHHSLVDSSRGDIALNSNQTIAEFNVSDFNRNSGTTIDVPAYGNDYSMNTSSHTYVSWNWKANGGTTSSITTGTIDTVVQANTTAGFSIVKYTGIGTSGTAYHGLSKAPEAIWIKDRDNSTNWRCWHTGFGNITTFQKLNSDDGYGSASMWGTPTADAFILGGSGYEVNESSTDYVAYCWHSVDGFSKFGKYVGNNSSNGPFIYTGFKPALVIVKGYTIGSSWIMMDNKRDPFNAGSELYLMANSSNAEAGSIAFDFLSNGFKCRDNATGLNGSYTYVYYAWAEHPFVGNGVNPVTAR